MPKEDKVGSIQEYPQCLRHAESAVKGAPAVTDFSRNHTCPDNLVLNYPNNLAQIRPKSLLSFWEQTMFSKKKEKKKNF